MYLENFAARKYSKYSENFSLKTLFSMNQAISEKLIPSPKFSEKMQIRKKAIKIDFILKSDPTI